VGIHLAETVLPTSSTSTYGLQPSICRHLASDMSPPHVFRHSCAVALLQAGMDITVIRDYLGHASIATTSRYIATNLSMKRTALEAFWAHAGLSKKGSATWKPKPELLKFLDSL